MSHEKSPKSGLEVWEPPRLEEVALSDTAAQKLSGASENDFQSPDNPVPPS